MTPLIAAVQQIHIPIVQCLLQALAQINGTIPQGTTPLHFAAQTGNTDLVQLLCQHMANVRSTSHTGDGWDDVLEFRSLGKQSDVQLVGRFEVI